MEKRIGQWRNPKPPISGALQFEGELSILPCQRTSPGTQNSEAPRAQAGASWLFPVKPIALLVITPD
jgi:hypothetical protein